MRTRCGIWVLLDQQFGGISESTGPGLYRSVSEPSALTMVCSFLIKDAQEDLQGIRLKA